MFEDISFRSSSKAFKNQSFQSSSSMDSSVSPTSSRDTSPSFEEGYTRRSSASSTIDELSQHFDRHNLDNQRPDVYLEATPSRPHNFEPSTHAQQNLKLRNDASCLRQHRQALARRHGGADRSSHPSTIPEDRLSETKPYHDPSRQPSLGFGSPLQSQWQPGNTQPLSSFSFPPLPISPPYSEDSEPDPARALRTQHMLRIGKELRHSASRDAMPKQRVVLKKIRRRKSSLRKAAAAERAAERQ